ncbi:ribosomal protein L28e [Ascobolus immersus RN42]|uniref:Ribosomal protein L28e n=1 Tax=Ascobolus immersus RN42 TaxID=1160509 RepID=A0A3N4IQF8_ASCIM|nr:ribosomal protein L28e [Ascobolus immersus RN42]
MTVTFSREPLNLVNLHSRKYSGLVNEKAIGVVPAPNGGVTLLTKKDATKHSNKPASVINSTTFGPNTQPRKTYAGIVNSTAKKYYRPDLRKAAVARASAIKLSQRAKKDKAPAKPRGKKAVVASS